MFEKIITELTDEFKRVSKLVEDTTLNTTDRIVNRGYLIGLRYAIMTLKREEEE